MKKTETKKETKKENRITFLSEGSKFDTIGVIYNGIILVCKVFQSNKTESGLFVAPTSYKYNNEYKDCFGLTKKAREEIEKMYVDFIEEK